MTRRNKQIYLYRTDEGERNMGYQHIPDVADVTSILDTEVQGDFVQQATVYLRVRDQIQKLTKENNEIKAALMEMISLYGYESKGSMILDLPKKIRGVSKMVRQRRASRKFDEQAAERFLRAQGLWDRCTKQVTSLDEDEVMACLYEGLITEEDLDKIFPVKETFALVPTK